MQNINSEILFVLIFTLSSRKEVTNCVQLNKDHCFVLEGICTRECVACNKLFTAEYKCCPTIGALESNIYIIVIVGAIIVQTLCYTYGSDVANQGL